MAQCEKLRLEKELDSWWWKKPGTFRENWNTDFIVVLRFQCHKSKKMPTNISKKVPTGLKLSWTTQEMIRYPIGFRALSWRRIKVHRLRFFCKLVGWPQYWRGMLFPCFPRSKLSRLRQGIPKIKRMNWTQPVNIAIETLKRFSIDCCWPHSLCWHGHPPQPGDCEPKPTWSLQPGHLARFCLPKPTQRQFDKGSSSCEVKASPSLDQSFLNMTATGKLLQQNNFKNHQGNMDNWTQNKQLAQSCDHHWRICKVAAKAQTRRSHEVAKGSRNKEGTVCLKLPPVSATFF